jgi:hypothetical protein
MKRRIFKTNNSHPCGHATLAKMHIQSPHAVRRETRRTWVCMLRKPYTAAKQPYTNTGLEWVRNSQHPGRDNDTAYKGLCFPKAVQQQSNETQTQGVCKSQHSGRDNDRGYKGLYATKVVCSCEATKHKHRPRKGLQITTSWQGQ